MRGWVGLPRAVGMAAHVWMKTIARLIRGPAAAVGRMGAVCLTLSVVVILALSAVWISRRKPLLLASCGELP